VAANAVNFTTQPNLETQISGLKLFEIQLSNAICPSLKPYRYTVKQSNEFRSLCHDEFCISQIAVRNLIYITRIGFKIPACTRKSWGKKKTTDY